MCIMLSQANLLPTPIPSSDSTKSKDSEQSRLKPIVQPIRDLIYATTPTGRLLILVQSTPRTFAGTTKSNKAFGDIFLLQRRDALPPPDHFFYKSEHSSYSQTGSEAS